MSDELSPFQLTPMDLNWILRRLPEFVVRQMELFPGELFLAGGFIRAAIAGEPINDIDLFVPGPGLASMVVNRSEAQLKCKLTKTENAWTIHTKPHPIQIIHRWTFNSPSACVDSFDFTIARAAVWHNGEGWRSTCDPSFYSDLAAKRLVYRSPERIEEAGGSLLRVLKFYQRGYRIPLDSLGAVVSRLVSAVDFDLVERDRGALSSEKQVAKVLTGLLREVDPDIDPTHSAHLPSTAGGE